MQPIRTQYRGVWFRSKLEAQWAKFFDSVGIDWAYEPEGYTFHDGTQYLPDFYLPESDSYFEVKGVMTEKDMHKIKMLIHESGKPVSIGYPNGRFMSCDNLDDSFRLTDSAWLVRCDACKKPAFFGTHGSWRCRCCRKHSGFLILMGNTEKDREFWSRNAQIDVYEEGRKKHEK